MAYTGHARIIDHGTYEIFQWERWISERIPAGGNDACIKTPSYDIMKFSVITLSNYSRTPSYKIAFSREALYNRDKRLCQYCSRKIGSGTQGTIDHVLPSSRGGDTSFENCVVACLKCNNKKGARTPEEAEMPLLTIPRKPTTMQVVLSGYWRDEWTKFLRK